MRRRAQAPMGSGTHRNIRVYMPAGVVASKFEVHLRFVPGARLGPPMTGRPIIPFLAAALAAGLSGCGPEPEQAAVPPARTSVAPAETPAPAATAPARETAAEPVTLDPRLVAMATLISRQQTDVARAKLQQYVLEHAEDGQAAFLLGLTYHREKRYTLARPWFESAAGLAPEYHPIHHFHGWCLYYLGDMRGARAAFERHLDVSPGEGDSNFALGLIALDEDRLDDARRRFLHAIELQQDNPRRQRDVSKAHARLADVHILRGELQQARSELQRATGLWPQHYTAYYKLSRVLNRLGLNESADEAYRLYRVWQARAASPRGVPEPSS